ncbi:MAG: DUF4019 domain-containing protein [Acidobacteria bacterium]|nr:DUF4019 domain-containing protein [Acidobacteriota bacterium]
MKNKTSLAALSILFIAVLACSTGGTEKAGEAVEVFHQRLNGGQFSDIYKDASAEFKSSTAESQLDGLLSLVKKKLGNVKEAKQTSWEHSKNTDGDIVTLKYDVEFANGSGTEEFMYKIVDEKALLFNYKINSPVLQD